MSLKVYSDINDPDLKRIWQDLYRNNRFLFPYSSWEYNFWIKKYKGFKPSALLEKDSFIVYSENGIPLIIIPLTTKKRNIRLFGDNVSGAGNIDCIYKDSLSYNNFINALRELKEMYAGYSLDLYKLNERSALYQFLDSQIDDLEPYCQIEKYIDRVCVKIPFDNEYDLYYKSLSKNCRSNLNKAYNKEKKTSANMHLKVIHGGISDKELLSDMMRIYTQRESARKNRKINFLAYFKHRYLSALTWAIQDMSTQYTFCFFLKNELAAFMTGFETNFNEIVFPLVAMNDKFSQYAPGKLMISESIKYLQENTSIRCLDMSRGDERYKLEMGGVKHYNYYFSLRF